MLGASSAKVRTMARIPDTPKVARRREREKRTISNMVAIYCAGNHEATARTETSHAGEAALPRVQGHRRLLRPAHRALSVHGPQNKLRGMRQPLLRPRPARADPRHHALRRSADDPRITPWPPSVTC